MGNVREEDRKILEAYAESRMRATETARLTHYDRRTIYRRLTDIKARTGIDPLTFWGLCQLLGVMEW